ncbi:MAG: WbqC family protein, partial [Anaerolineae bacterium]|nr:WbqC family protein [Anaerolineae bacterium]
IGISHTQFMRSSEIPNITGQKTDRLIQILRHAGAAHYISGPAAKDYIESEKFDAAGITLEFMEYNYPEYPQLHPPYDPYITILDLMFMTGSRALEYFPSALLKPPSFAKHPRGTAAGARESLPVSTEEK